MHLRPEARPMRHSLATWIRLRWNRQGFPKRLPSRRAHLSDLDALRLPIASAGSRFQCLILFVRLRAQSTFSMLRLARQSKRWEREAVSWIRATTFPNQVEVDQESPSKYSRR